jgi:hypothetical protein
LCDREHAVHGQIYPLQILIASLAGWMNRRQAEVLEYLIEENRVLEEQLNGRALPDSTRCTIKEPCGTLDTELPRRPFVGWDRTCP